MNDIFIRHLARLQAAEKLPLCYSEGRVCPSNLLFLGSLEEKQILAFPRFTVSAHSERDTKKYFFRSLLEYE